VPEQIRALEHPRSGFDGRRVERDDPVARLVLAPPNVHELLDEIDVVSPKVLHLHRAHRRVGGDDRRAVHVLPFLIRCGGGEQPPLFLRGQRSADGMLTLRQVANMVRQGSPTAAGLEHARQHAHVHIDGAVRDAGLVARALKSPQSSSP
jgi:hypothetical protein